MREVSDSLDLRRFCGLSVTASTPHESTIRKLVCRLGPEVVDEITRVLIDKAQRERRFTARAMRCDSTVVEAAGVRRVQNRSRAVSGRLRLIGRTMGRRVGRTGAARAVVLELTGQTGELVARSIREARRYDLRRSRLRGHDGARTWIGWGILTYNLDTLAVQTA